MSTTTDDPDDFQEFAEDEATEAKLQTILDLEDDLTFLNSTTSLLESYSCPICKLVFEGRAAIKHHVRRYFKYKCSHCEKRYFKNKYLKSHLRSAHLQSKELECPICHKVLRTVDILKQHLMTHSDERKYVCTATGCTRSYKQRSALYAHEKSRHRGIPKCPICRILVTDLNSHMEAEHSSSMGQNSSEANSSEASSNQMSTIISQSLLHLLDTTTESEF